MNKTRMILMLITLIGVLIVAGCARPQSTDTVADQSKDPAPDQAISEPKDNLAVESVINQQTVQPVAKPLVLEQVLFEFNQSTLSAKARKTLETNAAVLQTVPTFKISIEGHCDDRGSDEYNLALGEHRAQSVKTFMVSLGIEPERLETISYGEDKPIDEANNENAWARNRRAEFRLHN